MCVLFATLGTDRQNYFLSLDPWLRLALSVGPNSVPTHSFHITETYRVSATLVLFGILEDGKSPLNKQKDPK
jgi:hypothetical protein